MVDGQITDRVMLINECSLTAYLRSDRLQIAKVTPEVIADRIAVAESQKYRVVGSTAVIPIHGPIEYKLSFWGWVFGGTSSQSIARMHRQAMSDPDVSRIVFDVDSPGGEYTGTPETGRQIYESRGVKPMDAIANPTAASGAIWLSAAVDNLYVYGSGQAGSIGAVTMMVSQARALEQMGIDVELIRSPKYKAESNAIEPISEERRQHQQAVIDEIADEFADWIAECRGVSKATVRSDFGEGRMMGAKQAVGVGLCDGIAALDQLIQPATGKTRSRRVESAIDKRRLKLQG